MATPATAFEQLQLELINWARLDPVGEAAGDSYISIDGLGGSKFNDRLTGNGLGNVINGGLGNDRLAGGADAFVFTTALNAATNVDTITDFNVAADVMWVDNAIFTGLGAATGALAAAKFFTRLRLKMPMTGLSTIKPRAMFSKPATATLLAA